MYLRMAFKFITSINFPPFSQRMFRTRRKSGNCSNIFCNLVRIQLKAFFRFIKINVKCKITHKYKNTQRKKSWATKMVVMIEMNIGRDNHFSYNLSTSSRCFLTSCFYFTSVTKTISDKTLVIRIDSVDGR